MGDFTDKIRLKGKVEEDLYFAQLNRKLIEALREKVQQQHVEENGEKNRVSGENLAEDLPAINKPELD